MSFMKKKVLVVGDYYGHGKAAASMFYKLGANVAYVSESADTEEMADNDRVFLSYKICSKNIDIIKKTISSAIEVLGGIDSLVCFTESTKNNRMMDVTEDIWDEVIDKSLIQIIFTIQTSLPSLQKYKGSVVIVSGVNGLIAGDANNFVYSVANGGVTGFVRTLSLELAEKNINVNAVCPGHIEDEALENNEPDIVLNKVLPMGRKCSKDEFLSAIEYLSSEAASYCTGTSLIIDGGCLANSSIAVRPSR